MKVLFISRRFYPDVIGGGQISAYYIARAIAKKGHSVYVCTFSDRDRRESIDNIGIYRMKIPTIKMFPRLSNMDYMYLQMAHLSSRIIRKIRPDIIHLLNFESIPLSSVYYKRFKIPVIATVNGPMFGCFTQNSIDFKKDSCVKCRLFKRYICSVGKWGLPGNLFYVYSIWYMNMLKFSYRYVDRFCTISNAMVPLLTNMGVNKDKIRVIHNPIGETLSVDTNLLKHLKKRYSRKIVLCASRLSEDKGVQYVIKAMEFLPKDYKLLVLGKGEYEKRLKEISSKRIFFLGSVKYREMGTYYKLADVFCHFPTYYEAFGRSLIEAMSLGTPVIAYPIGGITDIVNDNINGLLVKSRQPEKIAQAIMRITQDKHLHSVFSANAKVTVRDKFSDELIADKYIKNYMELK
jgi:glycosyltransferase involved in cell wall biosynthesis